MKTSVILASAAVAALGLAAAAPASAQEVHIKNAVARVVVIVEDRTDIAVEIEPGSSTLPQLEVTRRGDAVRIDGQLRRNAITRCQSGPAEARQPGEGASVEVRGTGRVELSAAPLIVLRTPRNFEMGAGGAVFGAVGRGAAQVELGSAGCGDWTVANVDGPLTVSIAGSGDIRTGTSRSLTASIAGSGNIMTAETGAVEANIAGSGDIAIAAMNGDFEGNIAGSGNITVMAGQATRLEANIAGSGDIDFRGTAASAEANLMGSGDVRVMAVTGATERNVIGSGRLTVGQ